MSQAILSLNAGSSSIKFAIYDVVDLVSGQRRAHGQIEGIGSAPHFVVRDAHGAVLTEQRWPADSTLDHEALLPTLLDWITSHLGARSLAAVGHRIVHGGATYLQPLLLTDAITTDLARFIPLAPLHQPHNLAAVRAMRKLRPDVAQVGCFDTAFHHSMDATVTRLALPRQYAEQGMRRYGFHGLSYEYLAGRLRELEPTLARGRVIAAHLGNGASLCAMHDGRSVDTTMGFTALDGLMMGTRCGSIDPGALLYLQQQRGMSASALEHMLYHDSGLLGVSGISNDMRTLLASDDPHAREAVDLYVFRIARETGAMATSLGGLDGLVFSAGIGEHAPAIRAAVCARLAWLGIRFDHAANTANAGVISTPDSRVQVRVIGTDEEVIVARQTCALVLAVPPAAEISTSP